MTDDTGNTDGGRLASRRKFLIGAGAAGASALALGGGSVLADRRYRFQAREGVRVRIENVSTATTLETTADGAASEQPVPLSPGAFAVHTPGEPMFTAGEPARSNGLEEVAEDGRPGRLVDSLQGHGTVTRAGAFTTPVGADGPGPIGPGGAYEFETEIGRSGPDSHLSLVLMFIPSNDAFYALGGADGLELVADGELVTGDVTDHVALWDAGTEVNQEPGVGDQQVQRQRGGPGSNVGDVEREAVVPMADVNGYDYPAAEDVVRVTVERIQDGEGGSGNGDGMSDGSEGDGMSDGGDGMDGGNGEGSDGMDGN